MLPLFAASSQRSEPFQFLGTSPVTLVAPLPAWKVPDPPAFLLPRAGMLLVSGSQPSLHLRPQGPGCLQPHETHPWGAVQVTPQSTQDWKPLSSIAYSSPGPQRSPPPLGSAQPPTLRLGGLRGSHCSSCVRAWPPGT